MKSFLWFTVLLAMAFTSTGCVILPSYSAGEVDLSKYDHLTVAPFESSPTAMKFDSERNRTLCSKIVQNVQCGDGGFRNVSDKPTNTPGELILTGTAETYDPGDPGARMMLIGTGSATFHLKVRLKDGATGKVLDEASVRSLFVIGGLIGGSVTEENFVNDLAKAIARGVTRARKRN